MKHTRISHLTAAFTLALCCCAASAEDKKTEDAPTSPPDYVRFQEDDNGARLQTAAARLQNDKGVSVTLIGAVHIADKAYYDDLNARFKKYEIVLYELVGGEFKDRQKLKGTADADRMKWIGWLQATMQKSLALTGQLEGIDYTAKNFVHADMSTGEFFGTQEKKQESFVGLLFKAWTAQMALEAEGGLPDQPGLAKILEILCRKDSPTELKRLIGREFDQIERIMAGVESGSGTVIIGERNRVALEVLDSEIAKGRKNIAIFYGAAHLPDMEQRLVKKGFKKSATDWMTAWNLPPEQEEPESSDQKPAAAPSASEAATPPTNPVVKPAP